MSNESYAKPAQKQEKEQHYPALLSNETISIIKNRVEEVIKKADTELGFPEKISKTGLSIKFSDNTRALGLARLKADKKSIHGYKLILELHKQAIAEDLNDIIESVIPHEIAHFVCFINYALKGIKIKPHGKEFKAICIKLGGCEKAHSKQYKTITSNRKPRAIYRFEYKLADGGTALLTKKQHENVQQHGAIGFTYKKTGVYFVALNINFLKKVKVR